MIAFRKIIAALLAFTVTLAGTALVFSPVVFAAPGPIGSNAQARSAISRSYAVQGRIDTASPAVARAAHTLDRK